MGNRIRVQDDMFGSYGSKDWASALHEDGEVREDAIYIADARSDFSSSISVEEAEALIGDLREAVDGIRAAQEAKKRELGIKLPTKPGLYVPHRFARGDDDYWNAIILSLGPTGIWRRQTASTIIEKISVERVQELVASWGGVVPLVPTKPAQQD